MKTNVKIPEKPSEIWSVLGIFGAILTGLGLFMLFSLQPMPATVFQVLLMYLSIAIGLGLVVAAALSRFLDNRSDWLEETL